MNRPIQVGDLVISLAGRDKDRCYVVVEATLTRVKVIDGKLHKTFSPKTKNTKHIKQILTARFTKLVEDIQNGRLVSNKKLNKLINATKQKLQED